MNDYMRAASHEDQTWQSEQQCAEAKRLERYLEFKTKRYRPESPPETIDAYMESYHEVCANCGSPFREIDNVKGFTCSAHTGIYDGYMWSCCKKTGERADKCTSARHSLEVVNDAWKYPHLCFVVYPIAFITGVDANSIVPEAYVHRKNLMSLNPQFNAAPVPWPGMRPVVQPIMIDHNLKRNPHIMYEGSSLVGDVRDKNVREASIRVALRSNGGIYGDNTTIRDHASMQRDIFFIARRFSISQ